MGFLFRTANNVDGGPKNGLGREGGPVCRSKVTVRLSDSRPSLYTGTLTMCEKGSGVGDGYERQKGEMIGL